MAIVMNFDYPNQPQSLTGRAYAESMYGDDGLANGSDPELAVGGNGGDLETWTTYDDGTTGSGAWVGWTELRVDAHPGGGAAGVELYDPGATDPDLLYTGTSYGDVNCVTFSSYANIGAATAEFDDVQVQFMNHGSVVDSYSASGMGVAQAAADGTSDERVCQVGTNVVADSVDIIASVRYTVPAGTYPGAADLSDGISIGTYPPSGGTLTGSAPAPTPIVPLSTGGGVPTYGDTNTNANGIAVADAVADAATGGDVVDLTLSTVDTWILA